MPTWGRTKRNVRRRKTPRTITIRLSKEEAEKLLELGDKWRLANYSDAVRLALRHLDGILVGEFDAEAERFRARVVQLCERLTGTTHAPP